MQRIGITLAGLAALSAAAAHAQLERYMGGGVGNGAPPREALVIPYHLDFTDRLCLADYEHLQARCVQAVVTKLADFAGRPVGIARDPATGRVYVSTLKLGTTVPPGLWVIEPDGATRALPLPAGAAPYGVLVRDGFLWYADQQRNEVVRLPLSCAPSCTPEVVVAPAAGLRNPQDLAWCDGLLIADTSNHRIVQRSADGTLVAVAGTGSMGFSGDGGPASAAQLAFPTGLTALGAAPCAVYVADTSNNRVRRFAPGATIATVAGNGQTNANKLAPAAGQDALTFPISQPNDAAVDPRAGMLYVSSNFDGAVYRFPVGSDR
jgi:DNA-binding beta-propeller fold protein YncE